ncbi:MULTISPECIES: putative Ig domain-containing protein [unclassified Knoellia]|uniref:putative Ig domain-containing protein n=1 Tax=Knoellia altitudinis TaxID=3404795 RepID=UPI00361F1299
MTRPTASNVNYAAGQTVANQVVIKVGSSGVVNLFASTSAHVIADVAGYYPVGAPYNPVVPARLIDTRTTSRPASGSTTSITVTGRGGVPTSNVAAVVLTVTAVAPAGAGYLTQYPTGSQQPTASNVNYAAGRTVAGLVFAKVGTGGQVSLYTSISTHLLVDVAGWIPTASDYVPLTPSRLVDTRYGTGATKARIPAGGALTLQTTGVGGVAVDGVAAVELNVTAVNPSTSGYLTTYPGGVTRPLASTVNFGAGATAANSTTVKVGTGGKVTVYSSASTDLVVDVAGYFTIPRTVTLTHDSNTVIVPDSVTETVTGPTGLGGTGTITSSVATPAVTGQYVYLPPGGSNGDGLIGKVTAVNGTTTTVQSVPMQEAFPSGHIEGVTTNNSPLLTSTAAGDSARTQGAAETSAGIPLDCTNGLTTGVSVSATADMRVAVLADWGPGKRAHLRATTTTSLTYQGSVDVTVGSTCTWSSPTAKLGMIGPFTVDAGWKIELGISAGITTAVHHATTTTDGFDWWDGQSPTRVHANSKTTGYTPPNAATGTVTFGSGPAVSLKLAGLAGPQISALAYIDVTANTNANPWWTIKFGVKAQASLTLDILFLVQAEYTLAEAVVYSGELGRAPGGYTGSKPIITTTTLPNGLVGESYSAILTGSGGTAPYRWTVTGLPSGLALDAITGTITGTPIANALANPTFTITDSKALKTSKTLPLRFVSAGDVLEVAVSDDSSCALLATGAVKCWGAGSSIGSGGFDPPSTTTPVQVAGLRAGVRHITSRGNGTCAVLVAGAVKCWGSYNNIFFAATPTQIPGLEADVDRYSGDGVSGCALMLNKTVKCWGWNPNGQLGDGTTQDRSNAATVSGLNDVQQVVVGAGTSSGSGTACAVKGDGSLWCWGPHIYPDGGRNLVPVRVAKVDRAVASVAVADNLACVTLADDRSVHCWGMNGNGSVGNGTRTPTSTPVRVTGISDPVVSVVSGSAHVCAVTAMGGLYCWGTNESGEIGTGTVSADVINPTRVTGMLGATRQVDVGGLAGFADNSVFSGGITCAVSGVRAYCWGSNLFGTLGNGTTTDSARPVEVTGL